MCSSVAISSSIALRYTLAQSFFQTKYVTTVGMDGVTRVNQYMRVPR